MKKVISVILAAILIVSVIPFTASAFKTDITIDSTYSIVVKDIKDIYQAAAAAKLQSYLDSILGVKLPIQEKAKKSIVLCSSGNKSIYANGYRIYTADNNVVIDGSPTRGLISGVYRFLEEFGGLHIYTSKLTINNQVESFTVPADTNILYKPYFEYTDVDFISPRDTDYSLANGLSGGVYRNIPTQFGGTVNYIGSFCHTLSTWLCSADKYFAEHPEYFALHDGERNSTQLCLTNPDVVKTVTDEVLSALKANHNPKASLQIVSLTQNDNYNYCQCENCKAFEKAHGDVRSATIINFVNQVADAVKEADYKNVAIDTFAYQYSRQAPTGIVPRENVIVRLCTIECCFKHTLDDKKCSENVKLMNDLNEWSKICNRIYIWDYTNNYYNTLSVWPDFDVIQRNIQVFYEHNVKGIYEEGNFYMGVSDTEFGELKSYMISRCLQNPYCDLEKDVDGFLKHYYGDGWESIKEFIDLSVEKGGKKNGHMSIYEKAEDCLQFTDKDIKKADALWENALALANEDFQKENVKRSMLSYRYYKACALKGEFSIFNAQRFNNNQQLYDDIIAAGITCDMENQYGTMLKHSNLSRYLKPNRWGRVDDNDATGILIHTYITILENIQRFFKIDVSKWL